MIKMLAVFKREYLATVRKKMFIFMTLFFPVLMALVIFVPIMLIARSMGGKRVAVIDGTGRLQQAFAKPLRPIAIDPKEAMRDRRSANRGLPQTVTADYVNANAGDATEIAKPYLKKLTEEKKGEQLYDAVLVIPANAFDAEKATMTFYSRASTDIFTQERLSSTANREIQRQRLQANGISPERLDALMRQVSLESVQLSRSGEQKKGGESNFIIGIIFAAMLLVPSFMYGLEVMRGIVQEKTDRVVEVLISSMSSTQLLVGKILGMAAVGLTQIGTWLLILALMGAFGGAVAAEAGFNISQFVHPSLFVYFLLFFLLAYLINVSVYAIAGAACNTDKEAQQLVMPIQMVFMLPWFLMSAIITNPDSSMAVGFSMAPVYAPLTMFVRTLVTEPPVWHIVVAVAVSIATIAALFWATAKIFRVGILSYGKRPTVQELWHWLKIA